MNIGAADKFYIESIKNQLSKQKNYFILKDSKAGEEFIDNLKKEIDDKVDEIVVVYRNIEHVELLKLVVQLETLKDLLETIINAEEKVKILETELKSLMDKK